MLENIIDVVWVEDYCVLMHWLFYNMFLCPSEWQLMLYIIYCILMHWLFYCMFLCPSERQSVLYNRASSTFCILVSVFALCVVDRLIDPL